MKGDLSSPNSSKPPAITQTENQSEKQKALTALEISGLIIHAVVFVLLYGLPPTSPAEWVDWFFGHSRGMRSPMSMLFMFCALWWLLVLRHNKPW